MQQSFNFILVCRPESHKVLYEHLLGMPLPRLIRQHWNSKLRETYTYRDFQMSVSKVKWREKCKQEKRIHRI